MKLSIEVAAAVYQSYNSPRYSLYVTASNYVYRG
jgi:hypothetical protein